MEELTENVIEQTEQLVNNLNEISDEEFDNAVKALLNVSDEEINSSLNALKPAKEKKQSKSKTAAEIVDRYLSTRSDAAWKELQEFFWYGIKQFAFKYVKNWDDAYDMTIETFISAMQNIDSYDPNRAAFSTWLWTICRNACLYHLKEKARIPVVDNDIADIYDSEMISNSYTNDINTKEYKVNGGGAVENIDRQGIIDELANVSINEMKNIGGLSGQILQMKLVDNMKIREIADKLNMNESTIKNYLYKGKENLSRILRINHKNLYDMYIEANADKDNNLYYMANYKN